jgi:excisionase family DNA binding protein
MEEHQTESPERVWFTYAEASTRTSLHPSTLFRAVQRGDLRVGGIGRAPRFHVDELDEFMRRGRAGRVER